MKRTNGNGLNGSHDNQSKTLTETHFLFKVTNKNKTKKKCFQVSPFHTRCILMRRHTCSEVKGSENVKKAEQTLESGGLRAVKFKFCHSSSASLYKKMLQLV